MAKSIIIQMEWPCPNCETVNPGPAKFCGSCGRPKGNIKNRMPSIIKAVTDRASLNAAAAGPDIVCTFCEANNVAGTKFCTQCGADLVHGTPRITGTVVNGETPDVSDYQPDRRASRRSVPVVPTTTRHITSRRSATTDTSVSFSSAPRGMSSVTKTRIVQALVIVVIATICALGSWFAYRYFYDIHELPVTVERTYWSIPVTIQKQEWVEHEDWRHNVPSDAKEKSFVKKEYDRDYPVVGKESKEVSCEKPTGRDIPCGEPRDLGNGYAEQPMCAEMETTTCTIQVDITEEVIIEKDWVTYETLDWVYARSYETNGTDTNPYPPSYIVGTGERDVPGIPTYTIYFKGPEDTQYLSVSEAQLRNIQIGQQCIGIYNFIDVLINYRCE